MQNVLGPTLVAMATKFGLGVEIQSPTGLLKIFVCVYICTHFFPFLAFLQTAHYFKVTQADLGPVLKSKQERLSLSTDGDKCAIRHGQFFGGGNEQKKFNIKL